LRFAAQLKTSLFGAVDQTQDSTVAKAGGSNLIAIVRRLLREKRRNLML
jgi:hypothetical protein